MKLSYRHTLLGVALMAGLSAAEMQSWTSVDGKSVEGEFVRCFGNTVTLKRANGTNFSVMISSLSEQSRQEAKRLAQAAKAPTSKALGVKPATLTLSSSKDSGVPSDEEIKAFLTEYQATPNSDEVTQFNANFSVPTLKPDQVHDYARKSKVPFRVTLDLLKSKTVDGKKRFTRMEGQGYIVVLNEAGDVVDRKREALGKLCPS